MAIHAGDRFICLGPAGGGFGAPLARDPARVVEDVLDGLISAETAKRDYGVVLSPTGALDPAATDLERHSRG